ncbi:MAG: ABC transporter substrate-binding protein [Selenomonas sp.]|uniref:ABC transporter substrate-binding protein n=1 Tax=Selenomonas sp. TaxID=2053611 RepID=UPI0025D99FE4|nr:ABC transporter substrate-binding protein [Selenomonas sp.]MCR5439403.1 ABC transporter substrate-binding protein [Selenomonas sp.]
MKRILAILTILLTLFTAAGCGQLPDAPRAKKDGVKTIRIAYLPITHALPLFAAKELQTAEGPVKIELIQYGSWPELMDALNTGKVDGASVLAELAVKAKEQGIDVKAAALGHRDGNAIIVDNDIQKPADLKGKVFAIPHKQSSHKLLLDQLLTRNGLTEKDLTVVEMSPPEMPAALATHQIAGYCVAEPFGAKSVVLGNGHELIPAQELWPDSICCLLVFNGEFLAANHDLTRQFVQQYKEAGKYLTEHPEDQKTIALKYLKAKDKILDLSLQWISYDNLAIPRKSYDELITRMESSHLLTKAPSYEDFVDSSLYE